MEARGFPGVRLKNTSNQEALTRPLRFQVPVNIVQCFGEEYSVRLSLDEPDSNLPLRGKSTSVPRRPELCRELGRISRQVVGRSDFPGRKR